MPSEWASERAPSTASGEQQALAPSVSRIGPELQRHADHLRPLLPLEQRGHGAVDPTRHRDQHPIPVRLRQALCADEAACASARCSASAASCAAWRLAGVSPPIASSTSSIPIRAASSTGSPSTISATAAVAARVAPQPSASKVTRATTPSSIDQRDPRQIATGSPAGRAGEGAVAQPAQGGSRRADSARTAPGSSATG